MDYAFQKRLLRYLAFGVAEDELDLAQHDERYHGGRFDPDTMTCEIREAYETGDLADVIRAEQTERELRKAAVKRAKEREKRETAERIERKTIAELTSRDYTDEDRKMVDDALRHVLTAKPVEVTMQEANKMMRSLRANKPKDVVANMIQHFESTYPDGIEVPGIGKVEVNRASAKSIMAHASRKGIPISLYAALSSLDKLLKKSCQFSETERWKGRSYDSFGFAAPAMVGNQQKVVEFTVTRYPMGKQELYNIKVIPKEIVEERGRLDAAPLKSDRGKNQFLDYAA